MNYLGGLSLITRILIKGETGNRKVRVRTGRSEIEDMMMDAEVREERFADDMLLGLKVEWGCYLKK